jgi:CBS domain-containing protein
MTTAREIMTSDPTVLDQQATAAQAAEIMANEGIGAIPVCDGGQLRGVITDRDIAVSVVAKGLDPAVCKVIDLVAAEAVTIGADDDAEELLRTMAKHQVRRLPVIDGDRLVGVVSQADVARALPRERVGEVLAEISS